MKKYNLSLDISMDLNIRFLLKGMCLSEFGINIEKGKIRHQISPNIQAVLLFYHCIDCIILFSIAFKVLSIYYVHNQ